MAKAGYQMNAQHAPVVVVLPGDLHLTEAGRDNHRVAESVVSQINDLVRPDFVQFVGDNVQDATDAQFRLFTALTRRLRVPWFALVGDHDAHDDPAAEKFRAHVGEPCGSSTLRGFRCVRLNTQEARPVGMSTAQTAWFRAEVEAAHAAGQRVVVFQHNYPYKVWESFDGPGLDAWRETVQTQRIAAILTGHTHYGQTANDGRNVVVAVRSIGDPEGGPPGYAVLFLHAEDLAIAYRPAQDRGPLVLITHPREQLLATGPAHVVRGPDEVRVRVWSARMIAIVEACIDGGTWVALRQCGDCDWSGLLAGDRLENGTHTLSARALDADGGHGELTIAFAVDPTGRYTAVPCVRPEVASTAFC